MQQRTPCAYADGPEAQQPFCYRSPSCPSRLSYYELGLACRASCPRTFATGVPRQHTRSAASALGYSRLRHASFGRPSPTQAVGASRLRWQVCTLQSRSPQAHSQLQPEVLLCACSMLMLVVRLCPCSCLAGKLTPLHAGQPLACNSGGQEQTC